MIQLPTTPIDTWTVQELFILYEHQIESGGDIHYINKIKNLIKEKVNSDPNWLEKCNHFSGMCSELTNDVLWFERSILKLIKE